MLVITSNVFLLLLIALIVLAAFPDRIRNQVAYRRAVLACVSVLVVYGVGIGLLSIIGMPFFDFSDIRRPEDLSKFAWIGLFVSLSWLAVAVGYWSAFRAATEFAPLRSGQPKTREVSSKLHERSTLRKRRPHDSTSDIAQPE